MAFYHWFSSKFTFRFLSLAKTKYIFSWFNLFVRVELFKAFKHTVVAYDGMCVPVFAYTKAHLSISSVADQANWFPLLIFPFFQTGRTYPHVSAFTSNLP